jgi:hypothetical protein
MKKVGLILIAALLVVALPLSAMAGTQIYKAKDMDVDLWETCVYLPAPEVTPWGTMPVGPAYEFGKDVTIHYKGTEKFNARVKSGDVGWNRNLHGTATIYDAEDITGGGTLLMEAMSVAPKLNLTNAAGSTQSMYPGSCFPMYGIAPRPGAVPLYEGPFQVEEVVQDDGGDFGCFNPLDPAPVNFQDCYLNWSPAQNIDYLMLHVKITGNKIYFWKTTIHEPGVIQSEDHRGTNVTYTY